MTKNNLDLLLSSIAVAKGYTYSNDGDVTVLEGEDLSTTDKNTMAKHMLGSTATSKELESVNSVLNYIKKLPNYEQLVAEAKDALIERGVELPEPKTIEVYQPNTIGWMRQIIDICK